jgi:hypothetical protein
MNTSLISTGAVLGVRTVVAPIRPDFDRDAFLQDYLTFASTFGNQHSETQQCQRDFVESFLDHPEWYRPTTLSIETAYRELVSRHYSPHTIWKRLVSKPYSLDRSLIRDVAVYVDYRQMIMLAYPCSVKVITAEVLNGDTWEHREYAATPFFLPDWVELRTD